MTNIKINKSQKKKNKKKFIIMTLIKYHFNLNMKKFKIKRKLGQVDSKKRLKLKEIKKNQEHLKKEIDNKNKLKKYLLKLK